MQCPNCGSFKTWHAGTVYFWGGIVFAALSIPWMLILIGIPFFLAGVVLAILGGLSMLSGNPLSCRACHWRVSIDRPH
jgi:hypothetical protein